MSFQETLPKQQNWSDLPYDIVLLISSKLSSSLFDILSLKRVCSSWRIAMEDRKKVAYPLLVSLEESDEILTNISSYDFLPFTVNEVHSKRRYKLKKEPCFVGQYITRIIGSHPDGWVVFLDQFEVAHLIHLFRNIRIGLPKIMLDTDQRSMEVIGDIMNKAVLSAKDPNHPEDIIVVMKYDNTKLAFWKHGDCNWTSFGGKTYSRIYDIAFCNNTIYAFGEMMYIHDEAIIESWEFERNNSLPQKKLFIKLLDYEYSIPDKLVVSSSGEIFILSFNYLRLTDLTIYKVRYKYGRCRSQCHRVCSLGLNRQMMFLGFRDSASISSNDAEGLGYEANSFYFAKKQKLELGGDPTKFELSVFRCGDSICRKIWNSTGTYFYFAMPLMAWSYSFWIVLNI